MKKEESRLSSLFPVVVFVLMALCLMAVLLTGAGVYQRISRSGDQNSRSRAAALYLTTRVRQAEEIRMETFGGTQALVFPGEIHGKAYLTRVYCHEGNLWELFSTADAILAPEDGEILLELDSLEMSMEDGLLHLNLGERHLVFSVVSERRAVS